jgi:hypothetical protein
MISTSQTFPELVDRLARIVALTCEHEEAIKAAVGEITPVDLYRDLETLIEELALAASVITGWRDDVIRIASTLDTPLPPKQ